MQYTNYCSLFTRHGYVYLRYSYLGACGILKSFGFNKANAFLLFAHAYTICNSTLCPQLCSSKTFLDTMNVALSNALKSQSLRNQTMSFGICFWRV